MTSGLGYEWIYRDNPNKILYSKAGKTIIYYKTHGEPTPEDYLAISFSNILDRPSIRCSIAGGYIAILFRTYKIWMGSGKDLGDAEYLYVLFRDVLDRDLIVYWSNRLGVDQ